jgi:hypothetical protein
VVPDGPEMSLMVPDGPEMTLNWLFPYPI